MNQESEKTGENQEKKPKRDTRFKPGQSGNPKGRPKGSLNFSTIFKKAVKRIVKEKKLPVKDPEVEMVVRAVIEALKGNYQFYRDIMDRRYGKPKESVDITSDGEPSLGVIILPAKEKKDENSLETTTETGNSLKQD